MLSSVSSRSRFLSITSVALALLGACSDDGGDCGVGGAPASLPATVGGQTVTYTSFISRVGNDCRVADAPEGVISVTVEGTAGIGASGGLITFCIPRPDLLNGSHTIGKDDSMQIRLEDLQATITGAQGPCSYKSDPANPPMGTIVAAGACDNADNPAGFSLDVTLSGSLVPVATSTCTGAVDVAARGVVAVAREQ